MEYPFLAKLSKQFADAVLEEANIEGMTLNRSRSMRQTAVHASRYGLDDARRVAARETRRATVSRRSAPPPAACCRSISRPRLANAIRAFASSWRDTP